LWLKSFSRILILKNKADFSKKFKSFYPRLFIESFKKKNGPIRAIRGKNPTAFKSKEILKFYPSKS